ncbi:hypothetical protein QBC32DRAFT_319474 [Pseudoneurospora amorphoporcata]|uniref:Uncharacterized protein n=1 Tax=Pseudoneurospora amorphoporcata TaxID=241081 RepID=A0AAN6NMR6_9PEZI|nr:hypothetical protein QBC32DRAFT_319474 [Pseudoneurospora amorphoporcata]
MSVAIGVLVGFVARKAFKFQPDTTGLTWGRLIGLGFMILLFRRIPAILGLYKFMPNVCNNYKEDFFMGYFCPSAMATISGTLFEIVEEDRDGGRAADSVEREK